MFAGEFGWNVVTVRFGVRSLWPDWIPSPRTPVAEGVEPDWLDVCKAVTRPQSLLLYCKSWTKLVVTRSCRSEDNFTFSPQALMPKQFCSGPSR